MSSIDSKMTALANEVRELSGTTATKSIVNMTSDINNVNTEINDQSDLIDRIINEANSLPDIESNENREIRLQDILIKENGVYNTDITYDGFGTVTVAVTTGDDDESSDILDKLLTGTLTEITNDRITKFAQYAFSYHPTLEYASFPNVQYMQTRVFGNCTALRTVLLPNMIGYTYQYMCAYCSALTTVDVKQASYVSSYAFYQCTSLETLEFEKAGTIATNAFNGSTKLKTLILRMDTVPTLGGTNALTGTKIASGTGYIYVPSSLIDSYKSATNWSTYANQFRAIEDYPDICG